MKRDYFYLCLKLKWKLESEIKKISWNDPYNLFFSFAWLPAVRQPGAVLYRAPRTCHLPLGDLGTPTGLRVTSESFLSLSLHFSADSNWHRSKTHNITENGDMRCIKNKIEIKSGYWKEKIWGWAGDTILDEGTAQLSAAPWWAEESAVPRPFENRVASWHTLLATAADKNIMSQFQKLFQTFITSDR